MQWRPPPDPRRHRLWQVGESNNRASWLPSIGAGQHRANRPCPPRSGRRQFSLSAATVLFDLRLEERVDRGDFDAAQRPQVRQGGPDARRSFSETAKVGVVVAEILEGAILQRRTPDLVEIGAGCRKIDRRMVEKP